MIKDIFFWIVILSCSLALIWDLVSGPQKKFWLYKRANRKNKPTKSSKYAGSVLVGW